MQGASTLVQAKAVKIPQAIAAPGYTTTMFQKNMDIHPLKGLLDLVTRNIRPDVVLVNYFACNFMGSFLSMQNIDRRSRYRYLKIKAAVRVMVRFLDKFPVEQPDRIELDAMCNRIKSALLEAGSDNVKMLGKKPFGRATPLSLTIIRDNEKLLTDRTKAWYRDLPKDTPYSFIEHAYGGKIFDV